MATEANSPIQASGVQDLIDRLKEEGVSSGKSEAERLMAEARVKAMEMLDSSKAEAEQILAEARREAKSIEENGEAALRLASRDVVLRVREACYEEFKVRLNRLVKHKLSDPKLLEQMILEIAAKARPTATDKQVQLVLPSGHITEEDLQKELKDVQPGSLAAFVLGLTADLLREGLEFTVSHDNDSGVKIKIVEDDVQLELTDQTITTVLLEYLVPRYRAIMQKDT